MHCIPVTEYNSSHNNPCVQCNLGITNFLVSYTCEIRFHDVILRENSKTWPNEHVLDPSFSNSLRLIQLCDKKNLTFVDC